MARRSPTRAVDETKKPLDPERPDLPPVTVPAMAASGSDIGRYGTCCREIHAHDCPRAVNHLVSAHQTVGSNRFISVQCQVAGIRTRAEERVTALFAKLREAEMEGEGDLFDSE